ncbi:MAG: hypothetical protein Q9161_002154 [Pseudevernia consocians]
MPSGKRGDILLTTRNPECVAYETVGSEPLGSLNSELAQKLLLKATRIPERRWKEKEEAAVAVTEVLGSHTLAIVQAGAFVQKKLCSLEEYPIIFQQQKEQLLKFHSKVNMSRYGNVYATFEVSAEYLQSSALPECLDALNFLHILAFMHNSGISETLFQRASDYGNELNNTTPTDDKSVFSLSQRHIARLPEHIQRGWFSNRQDRLRWRECCEILESLSLIAIHEDGPSIGISTHSLIHAWAKERQDYQSRCTAWQSAATILALSCEGWYVFCPFFVDVQSHVRACVGHEIENFTNTIPDMEVGQILLQFAYVLYRTKNYASLSSLVQHTRSRLQDSRELDQELREEINVFTARVHLQEGDYGEAIHVFRDIRESRARRLAEDDSDRLDAEHNLADAYEQNGQLDEAVELFEHVVKVREKLAEDHLDRLGSQHALASAYTRNNQIKEAVDLLEHVVRVKEKLAEDYPDRLASQQELARAYEVNGRFDEAIELLEHVVKIREEGLAEDHPDRLVSQHELACAYQANGRFDEAIELLGHVVKVQKKLAEDHPDRLTSQHELARAYEANKRFDEAIELLEHVVKIREEKLVEDHLDRLASQYELAYAYQANGRFDEAIELLEHVFKKDKRPEDHPHRLVSQHALAHYRAKRKSDQSRSGNAH